MTDTQTHDIVEHASPMPFDETLDHLVQAITARGMTIFARIDHAANARDADLSMPNTTVLIYGSAKAGTPIMLATPLAALDLPLRVLLRQREDGKVVVAFHPIASMLLQVGVPEEAAARLEPGQRLLLAAIGL